MKPAPLRWTLNQAAGEFGLDRHTLAGRVQRAGTVPAEDGRFSTRQIVAAIHGDLAGEKLRKLRAEADLAELEAWEKQRRSIPLGTVTTVLNQLFGAMASVIKHAAHLSEADRENLKRELRELGPALERAGFSLKEPTDANLS